MVESNVKTGNIFVFIWNKVFKGIFREWTALIGAVIEGFKFVFITGIPVFIKDLFLEWIKDSKEMSKLKKENGNTFDKRVKEWFEKKYNNLSFVKEAKRKKEANLIPIVVDADEEDATAKFKQKQNFRYMAKNKEGKIVKDYFSAYSKMDVYSYLMDEGMTVYSIEVTKSSSFLHSDLGAGKRRMSNKDLTFWLTQLSTYVKAGIPLTEAELEGWKEILRKVHLTEEEIKKVGIKALQKESIEKELTAFEVALNEARQILSKDRGVPVYMDCWRVNEEGQKESAAAKVKAEELEKEYQITAILTPITKRKEK